MGQGLLLIPLVRVSLINVESGFYQNLNFSFLGQVFQYFCWVSKRVDWGSHQGWLWVRYQGWSWVGYGSGIPIAYPKYLPIDTWIAMPISIHTRFLLRFIIRGYPYPIRYPFNFFFYLIQNILTLKLITNNFILRKLKTYITSLKTNRNTHNISIYQWTIIQNKIAEWRKLDHGLNLMWSM